jgi:hypothetical protein
MDMTAKRAQRRGQLERMKNRTRRIMRIWQGLTRARRSMTPREVGRNTSTHCRPCGCWMCQEHAREVPQPRERAFYDPDMA